MIPMTPQENQPPAQQQTKEQIAREAAETVSQELTKSLLLNRGTKEVTAAVLPHILSALDQLQQQTTKQGGDSCPACNKALRKYNALDNRMARRGNFGIVPLPTKCRKHLKT